MKFAAVVTFTAGVAVGLARGLEYNCGAYPGSTFLRNEEGQCFCICDASDVDSGCMVCPDGYEYVAGKPCVEVNAEVKMVSKSLPLSCGTLEGPFEEGDHLVCKDSCSGVGEDCDENPSGQEGTYDSFGEVECTCSNSYKLNCPPTLKATLNVQTQSCDYKEPVIMQPKIAPMVPNPAFGFSFNEKSGVASKEIACPAVVDIPPRALICGPQTPPYIKQLATKVLEFEKQDPPASASGHETSWRECHVNCAAFHLKIQECGSLDCDRISKVGDTPIRNYLTSPGTPESPATFGTIAAGADPAAMPNRLYTSAEGGSPARILAQLNYNAQCAEKGPRSEIDVAATIRRSQSKFVNNPHILSCRHWGQNAIRSEIGASGKGSTVDACIAACDTKEYSGKSE